MTETAAASPRNGPFRRLYHWILRNAEGPYAYATLAVVAFIEASFFPMIPDIVMAPMVLANRRRVIQIALWCIAWSVIGGCFGYAIGSVLYASIGHWLVSLLGITSEVDVLRVKFAHNSWIILLVGLVTPFKLVSISSGIAAVPFPLFVFYTAVTRSVRFFTVGGLLYFFGEPVRVFLEKYLEHVIIAVFVAVVLAFVAFKFLVGHLG